MLVWSDVGPMLPWLITSVSVAYVAYIHYKLRKQLKQNETDQFKINPTIDKNKGKVKHVFKGNHLEKGKKLSLCRCWRSKTFPYCDGAHKYYNKEFKDNIGPVNIEWDDYDNYPILPEDIEPKTLVEDIQSMNASTELSSLEMIDSNGDNGSAGSHEDSHSDDYNSDNNVLDIN